jgi:hypothetical protein
MRTLRLLVLAMLAVTRPLGAEVAPTGPPLRANTFTGGDQLDADVAMTPSGDFVVVWTSEQSPSPGQDGSGSGIFGQRFAADGSRRGAEFQVNAYTTGPQTGAAVEAMANGDFVVVWSSGSYYGSGPDGSATGVFLRRFDAQGAPQSGELQVNTYTRWEQSGARLATAPDGRMVVVWQSGRRFGPQNQDGDQRGIYAQRFAADGTRAGGELQVNQFTADDQDRADVAMDAAGGFVVAWESGGYDAHPDGDITGVFARRFDAAGLPLGDEFQVNTYTVDEQGSPAIAMQPDGGFVVVWESRGYYREPQDGSGSGVFAQRFDAAGQPVGGELQVNTVVEDDQRMPAIAADTLGNFVVAWSSGDYGQTVVGQHFTREGTRLGGEVPVSAPAAQAQRRPATAADATGRFVVSWEITGYPQPAPDGNRSAALVRPLRTTAFLPPTRVRGARLALADDPRDPTRRRLDVATDDDAVGLGAGRGSLDDPTVSGASLRVRGAGFDDTYVLPADKWRPTRDGWQYADASLSAGPIRRARIRAGRLASAKGLGAQLQHTLGESPEPVFVILQTGETGQRWCMRFGGATRYVPARAFKAHDAGVPDECPT